MKTPKRLVFAFLMMGFTSLAVQTLMIREFLIVFYGNELTIGLILANWIILAAIGSWLGSFLVTKIRRALLVYTILQIIIVAYLPISIFIIRNLHNILGLTFGEGVGLLPIMASSFLILVPLSLINGILFPLACSIQSKETKSPLESTGAIYIIEAIGFILAGPAITLLFIANINSFSITFFIGLLDMIAVAILLRYALNNITAKLAFLASILLAAIAAYSFFGPASVIHRLSLEGQWKGQEVLQSRNSVYGNLTATKAGKQYTFYSDGIPIITSPAPNIQFVEELSHFSMAAAKEHKRVLLISGGAGGMITELSKYRLKELTYVELDPVLIEMVRKFPTELTKKELEFQDLDIEYGDGRRFILRQKTPYDVVIVNLPMPSTLQLNRFFSKEFFQDVRAILSDDGVFAITLPSSLSYLSPELRNLNGSVLKSLRSVFKVMTIPGDYAIYLASKSDLVTDRERFLKRLKQNTVQTLVLNNAYLDYRLDESWKTWFDSSLGSLESIKENSDLVPSATFYAVSYWNTLFSQKTRGLFTLIGHLNAKMVFASLMIVGLALLAFQLIARPAKKYAVGLAIGATGFAGMTLNLILIYAYQALYGFVFQHFAILVTAFMAGLTAGGLFTNRRLSRIKNGLIWFAAMEIMIIVFCAFNGPLLKIMNGLASLKLSYLFYILLAVAGFLTGAEFPLANKLYTEDTALYAKSGGMLYAFDLAGSYVAALTVSVALVPLVGIPKTCLLLALIKVFSVTILSTAYSISTPRR